MEGPDWTRGLHRGIQLIGLAQSIRCNRNDRVELRPLLVECFDSVQVELSKLARGQIATRVRPLDLIDRRLE